MPSYHPGLIIGIHCTQLLIIQPYLLSSELRMLLLGSWLAIETPFLPYWPPPPAPIKV